MQGFIQNLNIFLFCQNQNVFRKAMQSSIKVRQLYCFALFKKYHKQYAVKVKQCYGVINNLQ